MQVSCKVIVIKFQDIQVQILMLKSAHGPIKSRQTKLMVQWHLDLKKKLWKTI